MKNIETITDLRKHFVDFSGFSGGWNVLLESFEEAQSLSSSKIAVSKPVQTGTWLTEQCSGLAHEVQIGGGMSVIVIDNWAALVRRVNQDALRERLLVMITGNLFGDNWHKAVRFSGRNDGLVRRSRAGVAIGTSYWYPTEEQLASVGI